MIGNLSWLTTAGYVLTLAYLTTGETGDPCTTDGVIITSPEGNLTSPNYPSDYDLNLSCTWTIEAPSNQSIEVYFHDVKLEASSQTCRFDYLEIFDGDEKYTGSSFCGSIVPRNFLSNSSSVKIFFSSDDYVNERGFLIGWKFVDRCLENEFTCWNGSCIPIGQHCDHVQNCADNSDEIECAQVSKNFEECGKQDIAPEFSWSPRIIGGSEAVPGSWPWQAQLLNLHTNISFCGGTVIRKKWILTAAHCVAHFSSASSSFRIVVGRHQASGTGNEQTFEVSKIIAHPGYNSRTFDDDIALVELATSIIYTQRVRRICLPSSSQSKLDLPPGTICIGTGFGDIDPTSDGEVASKSLYQVRLPIVASSICEKIYAKLSAPITAMKLCAGDMSVGGVDVCQGDSGGPLTYLHGKDTWYIVGITSYGLNCADPNFPGVYTKVSSYYEWILQETVWNEACSTGVSLTTTSGSFSLSYDMSYHGNCTLHIVAPSDQVIQVSFNHANFEASCDKLNSTVVNIYDGDIFNETICEPTTSSNFTSDNNIVSFVFAYPESMKSEGNFSIAWSFLDISETTTSTYSQSTYLFSSSEPTSEYLINEPTSTNYTVTNATVGSLPDSESTTSSSGRVSYKLFDILLVFNILLGNYLLF